MKTKRRDFVKMATVGATGIVMSGTRRLYAAWPSSGTMVINPDIDNMSVVYCCDKAMIKGSNPTMSFDGQNSAVDSARVAANLDAMAMKLANKTTADDAWKTIFRSSKAWASTVVAIKVNTVETKNMPRAAVVQRITAALVGLGVSPSNIILYDAGGSMVTTNTTSYSSYCSTTDTTKILATVGSMGNRVSTPIGGGGTANCVQKIASGDVDIIVNIAVNKGHMTEMETTLCLKNHYGTFEPTHSDMMNYICNINKSDAIVGGTPPRQQLCIMDSLFAMRNGPTGTPDFMPAYLVMGVFAGAVDYLTATKVRQGDMKLTHTASAIDGLVTNFGYKTSDPKWIEVAPGSAPSSGGTGEPGGAGGSSAGAGGSKGTEGAKATDGGSAKGTGGSSGVAGQASSTAGSKSGGATGSGGKDTTPRGGASGANTAGDARGTPDGNGGANGDGDGDTGGTGGTASTGGATTGAAGAAGSSVTASQKGAGGGGGFKSSTASSAGFGDDGTEKAGPGSGGPKSAGSGCEVRRSADGSHWGTAAVLGAIVAGQFGRLLTRREKLASRPASSTRDKKAKGQ